jgi:hypothetical protein
LPSDELSSASLPLRDDSFCRRLLGVDVMITILCDFRQFLAKKLTKIAIFRWPEKNRVFLKKQCYDQIFA